MTPIVLTIAGSDPSGGAGIQADLRTFAALGVLGVSVITALTVQNSLGVQSVYPVPAEVLAAQLEAIFSDTKIAAVKIGMLGGAVQVRVVAAALKTYQPPNVVLDPVLASTGGVPLLDAEGRNLLLTELLPLCDLVTPNVPELGALTETSALTPEVRDAAARRLLRLGAKAVLVKGGHLPGAPTDVLIRSEGEDRAYSQPRVETLHTHGTGCFLSSAIAAYIAQGQTLQDSIEAAKTTLTASLYFPIVTGQGRGYPDIRQGIKKLENPHSHEARLLLLHGLYVLTDSALPPNRSPLEVTLASLVGGAKIVQLREKMLPLSELIELASDLAIAARGSNALFIVNDRVDVALASDADGVHLGPGDMRPEDARRLLGPDKLVGVSVATVEEARAAAPYVSYFGVGAIFGSKTKKDAGDAIGVGRIREIKAAFPHLPIVAIGGINLENIAEVAAAGADAAAVVSAVVCAPDMVEATRELLLRFMAGREKATD